MSSENVFENNNDILQFISPLNKKILSIDRYFFEKHKNLMIDLINHISFEFPIFQDLLQSLAVCENPFSFENLKQYLCKLNEIISNLNIPDEQIENKNEHMASTPLLSLILKLSYHKVIKDAKKLNKYPAFSPLVYGEVSFDCMSKIISEFNLSGQTRFIDLGSGVGQIVLQVAGCVKCDRCIGIEKAEIPFNYSQELALEYKNCMQWFGKFYSDFELFYGDFMDQEFSELIHQSNFLFANNFLYGATLNYTLQLRLRELRDGCHVVSTEPFAPLNFRLSNRTANDFGAIVKIRSLNYDLCNVVSWTNKPVPFYLHTIDTTTLENYINNRPSPNNSFNPEKSIENLHISDTVNSEKVRKNGIHNSFNSKKDRIRSLSPLRKPRRSKIYVKSTNQAKKIRIVDKGDKKSENIRTSFVSSYFKQNHNLSLLNDILPLNDTLPIKEIVDISPDESKQPSLSKFVDTDMLNNSDAFQNDSPHVLNLYESNNNVSNLIFPSQSEQPHIVPNAISSQSISAIQNDHSTVKPPMFTHLDESSSKIQTALSSSIMLSTPQQSCIKTLPNRIRTRKVAARDSSKKKPSPQISDINNIGSLTISAPPIKTNTSSIRSSNMRKSTEKIPSGFGGMKINDKFDKNGKTTPTESIISLRNSIDSKFDEFNLFVDKAHAALISMNEMLCIKNPGLSYSNLSRLPDKLYRQIKDQLDTYREIITTQTSSLIEKPTK